MLTHTSKNLKPRSCAYRERYRRFSHHHLNAFTSVPDSCKTPRNTQFIECPVTSQQLYEHDECRRALIQADPADELHCHEEASDSPNRPLGNSLVRSRLMTPGTVARSTLKLLMMLVFMCTLGASISNDAALAASTTSTSNPVSGLLSFILHLDKHMSAMIQQHGQAVYAILFAIVFCETGLVLTPFLPGDSLLFAAGAFAGMGQLQVGTLMVVFITAAILGDAVNYAIGSNLGRWAIDKGFIKQEYITKTEKFYAKYGGKTVVLARFVPIIRTFAPFVAGVGSMVYSKFALYNVLGALVWAVLFVVGGFFFGNLPFVQKNFTAVVLGIVVVSVVPVILEIVAAQKEQQQQQQQQK
ncbi:hypothetical protein CEUSTIGMA_g9036.t1 [Chlamydomonas eustigma]|uniref:VTT domain-containing protein n=1 Tax=Chlamydomonas eustigma TaxID=1157962 RepID=A0A250XEV4_9CHLO|nr:hypothetical protein CEUSTIGMA_g9036.t1 [Chlamydomonas eustigma]|eukprot:GAX81608.1 hypothetical protein CEUSTIGMA_g9036.t1 [Chlamydomonas eustigma]